VSNDDGAQELFPSDAEVSEPEDEADASVGIDSLNVGGNLLKEDIALDYVDPRGGAPGT